MLLYKYSLRFDYSCDVVKKSMINELVCVGREPLNGRMLTGKGYASLCQGPVPCTLIPAIRRSNNVQVYKCCRKEIYTISAAWNFLYLLWSNIGRLAMTSHFRTKPFLWPRRWYQVAKSIIIIILQLWCNVLKVNQALRTIVDLTVEIIGGNGGC